MAHTAPTSITGASDPQAPRGILDRARLLHVFDTGGDEVFTITDLREHGVAMPGQAIYELELDGYPVERVHRRGRTRDCKVLGYRLRGPALHPGQDRSDARRVS